ncbi:hypothetical protein C8R44DRAFT_736479 [Mycena epipterygia]|nr:hypothetical protein C8R44DRAFT_736479 [Mycena epipterygia]
MLVLARPHPLQVSYDYNILLTCLGQPDLRFSFSLGRPSLWSFDFKPLFLRLIAWFHYSPASGINLKPRNYTRAHLTSTFALEGALHPIMLWFHFLLTACIYILLIMHRAWGSTELMHYEESDFLKYRIIVEIYIRCTVPLQVLRESNGSIMVLQWALTEFSLANYRVNDLIVAYLCPGGESFIQYLMYFASKNDRFLTTLIFKLHPRKSQIIPRASLKSQRSLDQIIDGRIAMGLDELFSG